MVRGLIPRLNLRWLAQSPWRNLLVGPHYSSPLLCPSPARPAKPASVIIINNTPIGSPLHSFTRDPSHFPKNPTTSSPQSHNEAWQEFTSLQPTLMIPQAIIHKSIDQILLEHRQFLCMIPFVDVTHQNEMHWEFGEELNSLLGQALGAYQKEDITGIVSKYLEK
ncbi:hypothetical protein O181_028993 [Austropuccinia psidii MF-1]|uniref:Uncharacterized protein n=1 Tax=Austropuccinia psidii MF-1 TaxID=1389203 RepID=A0A9Q3H2C6_9BASI|nr:hypothetical protein [Austropuccinia psidii MF-1]